MFVGLSPFLSVLLLEATTFITVYPLIPKFLCFFKAAPSDRLLTSRQIFSALVSPINTRLPLACQVPTENSSTFHLSCSRFVIDSHCFILFGYRLIIIKLVPRCGKESSLFIPSFHFYFSPHPCCTLSTLADTFISSLVFPHLLFMKVSNIFCLFLSFCTFIIAEKNHLSRGF